MRKLAVFLLVAFAFVTFGAAFKDVPANHWAYKAVMTLVKKGIMKGYPDGTFKGNKKVTRFELAKILANFLKKVKAGNVKLSSQDLATIQKLTVELADELALLGVKVSTIEDELNSLKKEVASLKENGGSNGKIKFSGKFHTLYNYREFDNNQLPNTKKILGSSLYHEWVLTMKASPDKKVDVYAQMWWDYENIDTPQGAYNSFLLAYPAASRFYYNDEKARNAGLDAWIHLKRFFKLGSLKIGRWKYAIGKDPILYNNRVDFAVEFIGNKNSDGIRFKAAALNMNGRVLPYVDNGNNIEHTSNSAMAFDAFYAEIGKKFNSKLDLTGWIYTVRNEDVISADRIAPNFYGIDFSYPVEKKYNFTLFGSAIFEDAKESRIKALLGLNTVNVDNLFKIGFKMERKDDWTFGGYLLRSDRNFGTRFTKTNTVILSEMDIDHLRTHGALAGDELFANGYFVVDDNANLQAYLDYLSNANIKTVNVTKKITDRLNLRLDYGRMDMNKTTSDSTYQYEHDVYQAVATYKYSKSTTLRLRYRDYDFDKVNGQKIARDYAEVKTEITVKF